MRTILAVAGSIAVHVVAVIAFQNSAEDAQPTPNGQVIVTELGFDATPTLAHVVSETSEVPL